MGIVLPLWVDSSGPLLVSNWNVFFGEVTCNIQHAPGSGVDSAFIMISDTLDELDWEVMPIWPGIAQMNMYGREVGVASTADAPENIVNAFVENPQGKNFKTQIISLDSHDFVPSLLDQAHVKPTRIIFNLC
jgi:hypothetical protein